MLIGMVDVIFADVAQPDQARDSRQLLAAELHPSRAWRWADLREDRQIPPSGLNWKLKSRLKFLVALGRFPAKLGPRTPVNGSGSKNGAELTYNQLRRWIRMSFRDHHQN